MAFIRSDDEKKLEQCVQEASCAIVNVMVHARNGLRKIEEAKANPAYKNNPDFTDDLKAKLDEVEAALNAIVIPDYDYLKDPAKTPKNKGK